MKYFVTSLLVLAVAAQAQLPLAGHPLAFSTLPLGHSALPWSHPRTLRAGYTANQFHAQTELGEASFGYSHPGQAAVNYRDAHGNQVGSYAFINPEGKEVRVSYVADSNGFRVLSNDLPEAPLPTPAHLVDTPEVAAAKAAHFAAVAAARSSVVGDPAVSFPALVGPLPVDDTPEVKLAKAQFFAAFNAAAAAAV